MTTRAPLHCRTFIDNEFRPGTGGLERRNPATDELVAVADVADEATVDAAVGAASAAFATWGTTTGFERGHLLRELARVALDRLDDLATSMTLEMGKPLDEARGEVRKFAQAMRFYAEEAERIGGETIPNESNDFLSVVRKEPVGARGRHHAVELPRRADRLEARRRARRRLHGRRQAVGVLARRGPVARRMHPRGGLSAGRRQRGARRGRGRRPPRGASGASPRSPSPARSRPGSGSSRPCRA